MTRHWTVALVFLGLIAPAASAQVLPAQRVPGNTYPARGWSQPAATHVSQNVPLNTEELPPGSSGMQPMRPENLPDAFADDEAVTGEYYSQGGYPGYGPEDCTTCGPECSDGCESGWFGGGDAGWQFFATADFLYVRANFSEATEFLIVDDTANPITRAVQQLDFDYESSFRLGGGFRRCCCGDELRFLYTRFTSEAEDEVPFNLDIEFPFEPPAPPGGRTLVDADVDLHSYDLECAKTIPLGSKCCGCGDACGDECGGGCGECCAPACPLWDITWSGGIRAADVSWEREFTGLDAQDQFFSGGVSRMDFDGVGAKFSLEGRRYFFDSGWLSVFLKGDFSLLAGTVELETTHTDSSGTGPDVVVTQTGDFHNIIPVTEIETGFTGQVTCHSRISAGYLLSAWHDLGMRDEFGPSQGLGNSPFPLHYDDANILAFDGFFARWEWAY